MILYYIFSVDLFLSQWVTSCWEAVPQWQAGGTDTTISPWRRRTTHVKLIARTPVLIKYSKNLNHFRLEECDLPIRFCESSWKVNGVERNNCTTDDINIDDLTKPCQLFIRELDFSKKLDEKRKESEQEIYYSLLLCLCNNNYI